MDAHTWERIRTIYLRLMDLVPADRARVIEAEVGHDPDLRRELESILAADERADGFLEASGASGPDGLLTAALEPGNQRIGAYRIVGTLGYGGTGVVYDAEQDNPRRRVALKVIRAAPFLDDVGTRMLQREARSLAQLDHPAIASIYEAGVDDGWHYCAMERIDGVSLTQFAASNQLQRRDRLRLFQQVCAAMDYAHRRGVIHRDIKPSNILVTPDGRPRVLDFGLATLLESGDDPIRLTQAGAVMGTLAYMSPEQARGVPDDIDIRSDVYSLGVVLYELLTDSLPCDVGNVAVPHAMRIICEEPPVPLGSHDPELRGDLETIVHKALAKEAARRYQRVSDLASDVEALLEHRPIGARPASTAYHVQKWIRRNRLLSAVGAVSGTVVVALAIGMTVLYLEAEAARSKAEAQEYIANQRATAEASTRRSAEELAEFLQGIIQGANTFYQEGPIPDLMDLTDRAFERLATVEDPLVKVRIMQVLAGTYGWNGRVDRALVLLREALAITISMSGEMHDDVARLHLTLSALYIRKGECELSVRHAEQALAIRLELFGEMDERTAEAWSVLGTGQYYHGDDDGALEHWTTAVDIRETMTHEPSEPLAWDYTNLGFLHTRLGSFETARGYFEHAAEVFASLELHHRYLITIDGLARLDAETGNPVAALARYDALLEYMTDHMRPGHSRFGWILGKKGLVVSAVDGPDAADPVFRQALDVYRRLANPDVNEHATILQHFVTHLVQQGNLQEAAAQASEFAAMQARIFGPEHTVTLEARRLLASVLHDAGKLAEARVHYDQLIEIEGRQFGTDHPRVLELQEFRSAIIQGL